MSFFLPLLAIIKVEMKFKGWVMRRFLSLLFVLFSFVLSIYATEVGRALEVILPDGYTLNTETYLSKDSVFITENGEVHPFETSNISLPEAKHPYTKAVFFYAKVDSFQKGKVKVENYKDLKIYLDGKEVKNNSDIALTTGKHRFLLVFFVKAGVSANVKIELKDIDCTITSDIKKHIDHNDYIDFWYPYYFTVSDDGENVAVVVSKRDKKGKRKVETDLFLNNDFSHFLAFEGFKNPVFSGNDCLIMLKGKDIYSLDLDSLELKKVFSSEKPVSNLSVSEDGNIIYFLVSDTFKGKKRDYEILTHLYEKTPFYKTKKALFSVSIDGKTLRKIEDPAYIDAYTVGFNKVVIFKSKLIDSYPWAKTVVIEKDLTYLKERKIGEYNIGSENPVGNPVFFDKNTVFFTAQKEEYNEKKPANYYDNCLYSLSLESGKLTPIAKDKKFTTGIDIIYAYQTSNTLQKLDNSIAFIATEEGKGEVYVYNVENSEIKKIEKPKNLLTTGFKITDNGNYFIASDFNHFPALYRGDKRLFVFEPQSLQKRIVLSPYDFYKFKSKTGYEINNYLIYPANYDKNKKYPLIVFYYGGVVPCGNPFHPVFQYLSNNGYFVFLTTPRGAVGKGEKFAAEHCNEWGEKSAADLIEATEWICSQVKSIDKEKLGAYSGSYGGFLANTLAYKTTLFKALVSEYGISNIASYWGGGYWGYLYGMTALHGSYPWNAKSVYVDKSPLFNADKVKTPLLLMHGTSDVNVPTIESDQFFTALKVLGKDCVYIRFFNEDHGMKGKFSNWIAQENFLVAWFDKYLKGESGYWDYLMEKNRDKIKHTPFKDYFNYNGEGK